MKLLLAPWKICDLNDDKEAFVLSCTEKAVNGKVVNVRYRRRRLSSTPTSVEVPHRDSFIHLVFTVHVV